MKFKVGFCSCCVFLVLAVSGAEIIMKYVCSGDSVQAFQNIRFNKWSSVVSLYINGERNTMIARWLFENNNQNETLLPEYNDRVFLYSNGTVSIHNVHPWDEAKYIVNYQMGNISMEDVVQIIVMVAPANDCIPKILHQGSSLFASLKAHSCGKPVATLYWKGYSDFPNTSEPVLKLNPRNQDGTYYSCIEGPALICVKKTLDFCSNFTIGASGAGIRKKYVCSGDSVQAFQNIRLNNCSSVVSLYINGERNTLIARWTFENNSQNETLLPDYNDRVFLYSNGTVSIHNVHPWDEGKYIVNYQMGNISMEDVVQIIVMAAPANECIPKIFHQGSSLFASLKAHSCGKPVATVYWKGYDFVPKTEPVLKLNPGNQDGTYYACIEGPALTCVRNALDYCSNFTIGDKSPSVLLQTWDVKMAIFIVVGIVSGVSIILATVVILIRKRCRQTTSTLLKGAVENRRDDGNVRVTSGENEGITDGREVKDKNSVTGASREISRSDDQSDKKISKVQRPSNKKFLKVQRPSKTTVPITPRNDVTDSNDTLPSTSSNEHNSNRTSPSTACQQESLDSDADSNDVQDALLK